MEVKPIAIHLPQFHPFPENDQWWGKGFTEWTNVTKAKPLFKGHYQPHLPADLGFYDLRLEESRIAQAEMAKAYGIYGFCYYHYWFNGKRLLNRPLDDMLATQTPDFPFMLCWANENWSRRWDGQDQELLMKQDYSESDNEDHFEFLCSTFFKDRRYILVGGKPVFVIYKAYLIDDVPGLLKTGNNIAVKHGFPGIHFVCMDNFIKQPAEELGFSASIHFQPDFRYFKRNLGGLVEKILHKSRIKRSVKYKHHYELYGDYVERVIGENKTISQTVYPGITPGWDNTARRKEGGLILHHSTPEVFRKWLKHILSDKVPKAENENFLFINAWNEWAEGNHLEPCLKWGHQYLEVLKEEINN